MNNIHYPIIRQIGTDNATSIMGGGSHSVNREYYLVNTSMLVAYRDKPVSLTPARSPHGVRFDNVLTVFNSRSDNENRLKP